MFLRYTTADVSKKTTNKQTCQWTLTLVLITTVLFSEIDGDWMKKKKN
jgi:hypothetical protein